MKSKSNSTSSDCSGITLSRLLSRIFFVSIAPLVLASCTQDDAQLSLLVDSFNSQIDAKNKELEQVRASETQLRTQMAEISGRMQEMETQLAELKKSPAVTPEAVAGAVLEKIKPSLQELAENVAKSSPAVSASVSPNPAGGQSAQPAAAPADGAIPTPRVEGGPARDNVQRFNFSFP